MIADLLFAGVVAVVLPARAWLRYRRQAERTPTARYLTEVLLLLAVLSFLLRHDGVSLAALGLARPWSWRWFTDIALCLGVIVGVDFRMTGRLVRQIRKGVLIPPPQGLAADALAARGALVSSVCVMLVGAVWEELCFRGAVLAIMPRTVSGIVLGVAAGSLIFGMQHLRNGPSGMAYSTGFGLTFALLFVVTGNLWAVIISHAAGNLLTVWQWAPRIERARRSALQRVPSFLG